MDYQRACCCRMGQRSAQPVYRTARMNSTYSNERTTGEQDYMSTHSLHDHSDCCGNPDQNYPSLAIVTSPSQVWQNIFSACDAMAHGTLFCELYKPWVGCKTGGRMR